MAEKQKASGVIVGKDRLRYRVLSRITRRRVVILAVFIIVLTVAIGTYVIFSQRSEDETANNSRFPKQEVKMEQLDFISLQRKVNTLILSNQYEDARKLVEYQKDYPNSQEAKLLHASLYSNEGKHSEALEGLVKLESQFKDSQQITVAIAVEAEKLGDVPLAIQYYEKAISLVKKDKSNPVQGADIRAYEVEVKRLKEIR